MNSKTLNPVDSLEVTILADNYTDMFVTQDTPICRRPKFLPPKALLAEHGFSCLLQVRSGSTCRTILMDGGINHSCVIHNASLLHVNMQSIEAIVLSHGHPDHFLGLSALMGQISDQIMFHVHPDAFLERRLYNPDVGPILLPRLEHEMIQEGGAIVQKNTTPCTIAGDLMLMTGEIERVTLFEIGFPWAEAKINEKWVVDPFRDDQALVIHVNGKGLVIITGCAHAGIVNTILYAQKLTGVGKVHAVLGGFHLTGPLFESIIQPSIDAIHRINPDYVIPMHCTGWNAVNRFASELTSKFLLSTVGTTYTFS